MKKKEKDTEQKQPEDKTIFAPIEEIHTVERIIDKLEKTRQELQKVAEGMKPIVQS